MGDFTNELDELKTLLSSSASFNSKSEKSSVYSTLLQLQAHSTTDPSLLQSLAESSHVLLSSMANDISDDDEEIAAQALKCMGFMIYHPSIVAGISGDDADMVLSSLEKVILATRIKSVCNLGVWCISVQQFNASVLNTHIDSLVRALVHALDNPSGSLSTTFEAMQAVMKLASQLNEKMRETSNLWAPPIYRRLISADKREKDMSERCLQKVKSTICPPPTALSKVVMVDVKRNLLLAMEGLLNEGMKIQAMQAWGWFTRLIGPYAMKNKHLINQLLKIPEQTFSDSNPQVKIASQTAWEALVDALVIPPSQESTANAEDMNRLIKITKLIMTPLIGIMSTKCDSSVHLSCLNTWNYLLNKLDTFINHPSVIKTALDPMLEVVFRVGPDSRNIWSWNFCLDLLNSYTLATRIAENQESDDQQPRKHYQVKWTPWNLTRLDFFVNLVHIFISHGEAAYDAALKTFRSSLKGVQSNLLNSSISFDEVMSCIKIVIACLEKISEGGITPTLYQFIEIATTELQPSILGSPLYKLTLNAKYTEHTKTPPFWSEDDKNMVSPVGYLINIYFHAIVNSTSDPLGDESVVPKLSSYVGLLLVSHDSYDILHRLTCSLYKYSTSTCLNFWMTIANCLKGYIDGDKNLASKSELDESWYLVVSRFLAYPFALSSLFSQKKFDGVQVVEAWKSLYVSLDQSCRCCEHLFPFFNRCLDEYSAGDPSETTHGYEFLSLCGDAITCVLECMLKLSKPCRRNNDFGDRERLGCTKTSLQCAARFLSVSYTKVKANPQILDAVSRIFSTLARIGESFHFDEDIIHFVEVISPSLLQWLSDFKLQHANPIGHELWITTLKSLQISWPPVNFNSTLLKLQADLLEATLDHPSPSISNPTIVFWNSTYGEQTKLDYPQNLLQVLDKLSRNGKINLGKKRYSRVNIPMTPSNHKITTTLNRCVKRVGLVDDHVKGGSGAKKKRLELTEHQKEVRRAQQGRSKDCEGRGPGVRTYTSVDFSQGTEDESQEESQEVRNAEAILEMLKRDGGAV